MIHRIFMKTPDALDQVRYDIQDNYDIPEDQKEELIQVEQDKLSHWFGNSESVYIQFDTDAMTATVIPIRKL